MRSRTMFLLALISAAGAAFAEPRPEEVLDRLLPAGALVRPLSTDDVPSVAAAQPRAFAAPTGDFDGDGRPDMAISGVYQLRGGAGRYFLVVASGVDRPARAKLLFKADYDKPVFLHAPGTTGPADSGAEAFSLSFCWECDQGEDAFWDARRKTFRFTEWKPEEKRTTMALPAVPQDQADAALKAVVGERNVQDYIARMKKAGNELSVNLRYLAPEATDQVRVEIGRRSKKETEVYEAFIVETGNGKILRREKRPVSAP